MDCCSEESIAWNLACSSWPDPSWIEELKRRHLLLALDYLFSLVKRRLILGCVRCRRRSLLLFAPPASLVSLPDLKSSLRSLSSCLASREGSRERESTKDILQTRVKNRTWIEWRLRYKFRILFLSLFFFFYFGLCWTSGWWWRREKEDTGTRTRRETRERRTLGTTETNMNVWKDLSRGLTVEQNRQQIIRGEQEGEEIKEDVRHEREKNNEKINSDARGKKERPELIMQFYVSSLPFVVQTNSYFRQQNASHIHL